MMNLSRTVRIHRALLPHRIDLARGLALVADARVFDPALGEIRRFPRAAFKKAKVQLTTDAEQRLQSLTGGGQSRVHLFEVVNAALIAVRNDRLAPSYGSRVPLAQTDPQAAQPRVG